MTDVLLTDIEERVALVTLNRPEARNALSRELRRALRTTMADLDADDDVDVVILTGADPAFCAGLDLKELAAGGDALRETGAAGGEVPIDERGPFGALGKPVIGAINGVAITGGFEVALGCDFLIASEHARFADTHARVGIMPGWGLTVLLPQAVGIRRARQLSFTGNFLDADTALAWGLVNEVVPHESLLDRCRALAADIVSNDQRAVRTIRGTYAGGSLRDGAGAWDLESQVSGEWQAGGLDPAALEQRRQAVVARGRTQL